MLVNPFTSSALQLIGDADMRSRTLVEVFRTLVGVLLMLVGLPIGAAGRYRLHFVHGIIPNGETDWTDVARITGIAAFGIALF
jgi:hypothetical protein